MNFVVFSDQNYEYQVRDFVSSISLLNIRVDNIFYYTIGFDSDIEHNALVKIRWEKDKDLSNYSYYKAMLCLDALNRANGQFCYFDSDILLGHRFKYFNPIFGNDYPICATTPMPYPFRYFHNLNGEYFEWDETAFMNYISVPKRTMNYVYACFFTFDERCIDFFQEEDAWCRFKYFIPHHELRVYPFWDETIMNVLLWKRNAKVNYGRIFCNSHKFNTIKMVETNDNIRNINIDNNQYEQIENSALVMFYHGTKNAESNQEILTFYKDRYALESNG